MSKYKGLLIAGKEIHNIQASNKAELKASLNRLGKDKLSFWQIMSDDGHVIEEGGTHAEK